MTVYDNLLPKAYLERRYAKKGHFFVTFRLNGSLDIKETISLAKAYDGLIDEAEEDKTKLHKLEKHHFGKWDTWLDSSKTAPAYFRHPQAAKALKSVLHYYDNEYYTLDSYCIMPNHAHLIIELEERETCLGQVLEKLKGFSARECQSCLKYNGHLWSPEDYILPVTSAKELDGIVEFIMDNPVKAGLAPDWEAWWHTYIAKHL